MAQARDWGNRMNVFRVCGLLSIVLIAGIRLVAQAPGVGVARIEVADAAPGGRMPGFVFYPSTRSGGPTTLGLDRVDAALDAPKPRGRLPLVVLSHGQGGTNLSHHDLATFLAAHGMIVATIEHAGDNFRDGSGVGRPLALFGRATQMSALISTLLDDSEWHDRIDAARIGVAGFSMGGYTSLLLVGAVPRLELLADYCERSPQDRDACGLVERLSAESRSQSGREYLRTIQAEHARWQTADARVRAAFAMAPLSVVFDREGAARINRPVFLYYAENDRVLPPADNAKHVAPLIPTLVTTRVVAGAGHYVFLAPCSPALAKEVPVICTDPPDIDRAAVHQQINADALAFFRRTLNIAER